MGTIKSKEISLLVKHQDVFPGNFQEALYKGRLMTSANPDLDKFMILLEKMCEPIWILNPLIRIYWRTKPLKENQLMTPEIQCFPIMDPEVRSTSGSRSSSRNRGEQKLVR